MAGVAVFRKDRLDLRVEVDFSARAMAGKNAATMNAGEIAARRVIVSKSFGMIC